jgi:hypothetical protein
MARLEAGSAEARREAARLEARHALMEQALGVIPPAISGEVVASRARLSG